MILHVFPPDVKYFQVANKNFNLACPGQNRFAILGENATQNFSIQSESICFIGNISSLKQSLSKVVENVDVILVHFLVEDRLKAIQYLPHSIPIVWFAWGMDLVHASVYSPFFTVYQSLTQFQILKENGLNEWIRFMRYSTRHLLHWKCKFIRDVDAIMDRIDVCIVGTDGEYELLQKMYRGKTPKRLKFNYNFVDMSNHEFSEGQNILLGNSSWTYNNHTEAFKRLSKLELGERKVVVPLSYGPKEDRSWIIKKGEKYLGDRFLPILDFMPLDQYTELMNSCGHFVSNSNVQMAAGNILLAVQQGLRIHLHPKNPFYLHYKKHGIQIDDFSKIQSSSLMQLSNSLKEKNLLAIQSLYGFDKVMNEHKQFIEIYGSKSFQNC